MIKKILCHNIKINIIDPLIIGSNDVFETPAIIRQFNKINNVGIFKLDTGAFTSVCPFIGSEEERNELMDYPCGAAGNKIIGKLYFGMVYVKGLLPFYSNILHIDDDLRLIGNNYIIEKTVIIKNGIWNMKD